MFRGEEKTRALSYHPFSSTNYICKSRREEFCKSAREREWGRERVSCDPAHNPSAPACTTEEQEVGHKRTSHVNHLIQDQPVNANGESQRGFLADSCSGISSSVCEESNEQARAVIRQY